MLLRKLITAFLLPMGLLWLALGIAALAAPRQSKLRRFLAIGWLALTLGANPMVSVALVRSLASDNTHSEVPDSSTYDFLMVRVGEGSDATWLYTVDRSAPFGYIPALLMNT